jgi:hypothetical protein
MPIFKCKDPFSNAIFYALDQLIAETKTDLESTTYKICGSKTTRIYWSFKNLIEYLNETRKK